MRNRIPPAARSSPGEQKEDFPGPNRKRLVGMPGRILAKPVLKAGGQKYCSFPRYVERGVVLATCDAHPTYGP